MAPLSTQWLRVQRSLQRNKRVLGLFAQQQKQQQCAFATAATSRRARRTRRQSARAAATALASKQDDDDDDGVNEEEDEDEARGVAPPSISSRLSEMRRALQLVSGIDELARNGLTHRVEMPAALLTRLTSIVKRRTHSQLMQLHERMREADAASEEQKAPLDIHKFAVGWTLEREQQIAPRAYGPSETMAYLAQEMESTYACAHHAIRQLQQRRPSFRPTSLLDFGAGPGTASWAAQELFGESLQRFRVLEPSQSMVDAAEVLLEGFPGLSMRRQLSEMKRELQNGLTYDVIAVNFVLSELTSDFERVAVMSALWELLSDGGMLMIVDRGGSWGSHQVRSARQFLLDSVADEQDEDCAVVAPCPHSLECPAEGKTWCHFAQRSPRVQFPRDATTKRWHGHKVAKFSYVVMEKKSLKMNKKQQQEETKTKDEEAKEEDKAHLGASDDVARLIRGPLLANRHVHLDLCMPNGELERRAVTKRKAVREVYRAARKAHWGALWPADASVYAEEK